MAIRTQRWTVSIVSALIALSVGAWFLKRGSARELTTTVAFREPSDAAIPFEFPFVSPDDFFRVDADAPLPATPEARRFYMSKSAVEAAWGADDSRVTYDPWTYGWDRGLRDEKFPWPEHPRGRWHLTTNKDGLREVGDPLAKRCDVRVLATGDSHAFGVCDTNETFASQLEDLLAKPLAPRSVEVLNAAQPGFDAFNYLGVLHRFLSFEPQVFVVLFFGGNDLLSSLDMYYRFTREPAPEQQDHPKRRRAEVIGHAPNAFGQCYEGAPMLLAHPDQGELAARVNARLFAEMQAVCKRRGIRLIVVYLPSPCDLAWRDPPAEIGVGRQLSGLPEDAGSGLAKVEERFLAAIATLSIEVVDMRATFRAQADPPYWRKDLHLSIAGHRLVAEALAPRLGANAAGQSPDRGELATITSDMKSQSDRAANAEAVKPLLARVSRRFNVAPERVYDAFLDVSKARRFLYATSAGQMVRAELDPRVGGKYVLTDKRDGADVEHSGTFLELVRPSRIVYTMFVPGYSTSPDRVTVEIAAVEGGCEVTVTHEMLPEYAPFVELTVSAYTEHLKLLEDVLAK